MNEIERLSWDAYDHLVNIQMDRTVRRLNDIKEMIKTLQDEEKDLRVELTGSMEVAGAQTVYCEGCTVSWVASQPRKTLDKEKLTLYLVEKGVQAQLVKSCMEKATKVGKIPDPTVRIVPIR